MKLWTVLLQVLNKILPNGCSENRVQLNVVKVVSRAIYVTVLPQGGTLPDYVRFFGSVLRFSH